MQDLQNYENTMRYDFMVNVFEFMKDQRLIFLQFLSNLAMKEEKYFLGILKIWAFSSHTTTKV